MRWVVTDSRRSTTQRPQQIDPGVDKSHSHGPVFIAAGRRISAAQKSRSRAPRPLTDIIEHTKTKVTANLLN
ncbi:hypothetical protein J6590_008519 [Homalodisca vitripennis]|nr:hypothetical protein J6590_008519 [Homalodisca vitripennis]